ncbi:Replication protein C (plasmid) [Escherichia coli O25b:H4]|uniref:Replication protein C n=2 Tax=Enterobacteriaceae TaxID=543 RepID=A0A192CMN5_ECO25|nr:Replication protein C [Escherichia coli O25b:H4]QIC02083.1 Phage replication protein [Escherichia coli O25b:H4-ST131]
MQLHQQKGMISLSPPTICNSASIDTLCGYVWPSEASGSTMRKRRQRVREALPELVALGWTVTEFAAGKYDITRPKAAGCPPPLYCKQDIFIFYIQWLIFLLIGNTMKNTMLRKGLTIF